MRLKNLSWKQFEKIDREKPVIIPTGAIEVYGPPPAYGRRRYRGGQGG